MSEADTPNSNPIDHSATDFSDSHGDCQPSPSLQPESSEEQAVPMTPASNHFPSEEPHPTPGEAEEFEFTVVEGTTADEPVTIDFAQESDWFVQARKQRQRNRELVKTVAQLEQALAETQDELQAQEVRSKGSETLITQQAEELYATKQQLSQFFQDLETAHQTIQRQQLLIETLSEQLEIAQHQVAILEEECSTLREVERQQSQELQQAQTHAEDLFIRLQYQQRQAQQFKAALDKCLDSPHLRQSLELDQITEVQEAGQEVEKTVNLSPDEPEVPRISAKLPSLSLSSPPTDPADWGRRIQPWSLPFEQKLTPENLEVVARLPEEEDLSGEDPTPETTIEPEKVTWESEKLEVTIEAQEDVPTEESKGTGNDSTAAPFTPDLGEMTEEIAAEETAAASESHEEIELPLSASEPPAKSVNWPSPTLSPVRPPKKRKSLAAVDLPRFPRFQ